ncbi:MAG: hypothetical protein SNJ33_07895, partial [Rikenellaceae bacterium]
DNLSTLTVDDLITLFTDEGIWDSDRAGLIDDLDYIHWVLDDGKGEEDAIEFLEWIVAGSFDTSGEKIILADGVSYVNIVKSSADGVYYTATFNLSGCEVFEILVVMEEYINSDNAGNWVYINNKWIFILTLG